MPRVSVFALIVLLISATAHADFPRFELSPRPGVASDGAIYFAQWVGPEPGLKAYGARVHPAGIAIDRTPVVLLDTLKPPPELGLMVWDGVQYLSISRSHVAFFVESLFAQRIGHDGTPIDSQPVALTVSSAPTIVQLAVSAASNGATTLIAASGGQSIALVDHDLRIIRTLDWRDLGISGGDVAENIEIASDGHDFIVVYGRFFDSRTFVSRLSGDGLVLTAGVLLDYPVSLPRLVWTGAGYLLAYYREHDAIYVQRLDKTGVLNGSPAILTGAEPRAIDAASTGDGTALVWWEPSRPGTATEAFTSFVTSTGVEQPVFAGVNAVTFGARCRCLASNGDGYVGVLLSDHIRFVAFDNQGRLMTPPPIENRRRRVAAR
jgi:hypothetical protein